GDESRVQNRGLHVLLQELLGLLDQPFHRDALFRPRAVAHQLEDLLEARDLALGLGEVLLERGAQLLGRGSLRHPGEGLGDLLLGAVEIPELVEQQILQRTYGHAYSLLLAPTWNRPLSVIARIPGPTRRQTARCRLGNKCI